MDSLTAFTIWSFAASIIGVFIAFFVRRLPSHGWVAILLLLTATLAWMRIDSGESSHPTSLLMSMLFCITAPVAAVYSFRARRHAADRLVALAAFVGGFIIAGFYLFMLAGLFFWTYEIFSRSPHSSKVEPTAGLRVAMIRNARLQKAFEKAASQKSNSLTQLSGPAIDFLREEQTVLSNCYTAVKPLIQHRLLDMADIKTQADLEKRRMLVLKYIDANKGISNYYGNVEFDFRKMAIKGGLPDTTVDQQVKWFHTNLNRMNNIPALCEANERWAKCELETLNLLVSNRQSWSYDGSLRKTVFKDENLRTEFNRIVVEINTDYEERQQLLQQLQQELKEHPIR
jgi:uncharacterized membrane protein